MDATHERSPPAPHAGGRELATPGGAGHRWIAWSATALFVAFSLAPLTADKYRYSFLFLVPLVWVVYALRGRLLLRRLHFALFAVALLLHDLGAFGVYGWSVGGLQYDWVVHFSFAVVGGLIVARLLELRLRLRGPALALLVVLVITGIGALHEIVEAESSRLLGERGMYYNGPDNPYDSQEDLLCNVLGASLACLLHRCGARRTARSQASARRARERPDDETAGSTSVTYRSTQSPAAGSR
jgi:uncharacterized membrane protein YjdF